ncbi:MAG: Crp/Fnr family transcriptional regulator [Chitinophagaceae bacterium]
MDELIQKEFPHFERSLVESIGEHGNIKSFKPGDVLMRTGQNIRSTALVVSGLLKVYREDDEGNEFFMYYLEPGQACALSMVCATRQETSQLMVKAVSESDVIMVPLAFMDQWMSTYKSWYQFVVETYRSRFEELLVTIDHVAFRNMDERLEFYLQKHITTTQSNIISITHQEIANELNSSREVISRLMKKLAERGKVKLHRNYIEVINL